VRNLIPSTLSAFSALKQVYPEPEAFKPFDHFPTKCTFKTGFGLLRVFGGGFAPCPGKDYAISLSRIVIDAFLLSERFDLELEDSEAPLPEPVKQSVSSKAPPFDDFIVRVNH
jgi:hypothetical protein